MPRAARTVEVRSIVGVAETLRLCGGITRATLLRWRKRPGFPKPIRRLKSGELWDASEVRAWLAENPPQPRVDRGWP